MIGDVQKRLYTEPLNTYSTVPQWETLRKTFIFQCILCLQSQSNDFTNNFAQEDIPKGGHLFNEVARYLNNNRGQCDNVLRLKKSLYGQAKAKELWYKKLQFISIMI